MGDEPRPAPPRYDADHIARFFDAFAGREWERLERRVEDRVSFELHRRYLERFVRAGDRVFEAGAGPGRFTIELARIGARITVSDISPVQLELNRDVVAAAGAESAVVERVVLDILDLRRYPNDSFDVTVCYGGPVSYVLERADDAVVELMRVTKPGGYLLCSVASLLGTARAHLARLFGVAERFGLETIDREVRTGDVASETANGQPMRLYRWSDFESLLLRHGSEVVVASAANYLSVGNEAVLAAVYADERLWQTFLEWEASACAQPGALDGGTHIIAAARKLP